MDDVMDALAAQQRELAGLLADLDEAGWARPAPSCPGWTVADVVLHIAQTNEGAIASAEGRFPESATSIGAGEGRASTVDQTAELMVTEERGASTAELRARWQASVDTLHDVLARTDPHLRVNWVAGQLSVRTLATTRLAETWIHTNDVAEALGVTLAPDDRLRHIARLAWRTLPYAFTREGRELHGPVAFELTGPSGEAWEFVPDDAPETVIRGDGVELCLVAARRRDPATTGLTGDGSDAQAVLELVRTYA
ncbi:MAG TPA: maleylpyruvate isomerase family mycothiol-dependent enzyme [Acidimicrobiia bacterium]